MRVDFYHLTRDPAEAVIPALAENTLKAGERLLVVSADAEQRQRVSRDLWTHKPESFLAHGQSGEAHASRQPILLAEAVGDENAARFLVLADGVWREEALGYARVFYLFEQARIEAARDCWRRLGKTEGVERHFWKQEGRKWVMGP